MLSNILFAMLITGVLNSYDGINWYNGHKESYYNLPMSRICQKAQDSGIPGEYWINPDTGVKMYGNFVIVAADFSVHPYGSVVETSHGPGLALDTGDFKKYDREQIDIATDW